MIYSPDGVALDPLWFSVSDPVVVDPPDNSAGTFDYGRQGKDQRPVEHAVTLLATIEMGARQYVPSIGRFIEIDPVEGAWRATTTGGAVVGVGAELAGEAAGGGGGVDVVDAHDPAVALSSDDGFAERFPSHTRPPSSAADGTRRHGVARQWHGTTLSLVPPV